MASQAQYSRRYRKTKGLVRKNVRLPKKYRGRKAKLLGALGTLVERKYETRLRVQDIRNGRSPFPRVRVLRSMSPGKQQVLKDILLGEHSALRVNQILGTMNWLQTNLLIDVVAVAPVNVLYVQNLSLDDFQLRRFIGALKANKKIIAVNMGEVGAVSASTWRELAKAIPETNVSFMYVSETQAGKSVAARLKALTKANRDTTMSSVDWRLVGAGHDITKMWWNPTNSKRLDSIP